MADLNMRYQSTVSAERAAEIDAGLRLYMNKVYALMAGAMVLTGLVAYVFGSSLSNAMSGEPSLIPVGMLEAMYTSPGRYIIMFAPLIFVFGFSAMINRMSAATAQMVFWAFGAVMGMSISWIFAVYTEMSIFRTFLVTAIAFGSLSIYGYTTKRDLSGMGSFLMMGLFGLIGAMIVNMFLGWDGLQFAISVAGVLIFAGLTAYDTQNIKNEYLVYSVHPEGRAMLEKGPVMGALRLYLDFINLFMFLLQFLGNRE